MSKDSKIKHLSIVCAKFLENVNYKGQEEIGQIQEIQ